MVRRQGPQLRSLIYDKADAADHVMRPRQRTPIKVRSATAPATGRIDSRIPRPMLMDSSCGGRRP